MQNTPSNKTNTLIFSPGACLLMHTLFTAQTSQLLTRKQVPVCLQFFSKWFHNQPLVACKSLLRKQSKLILCKDFRGRKKHASRRLREFIRLMVLLATQPNTGVVEGWFVGRGLFRWYNEMQYSHICIRTHIFAFFLHRRRHMS